MRKLIAILGISLVAASLAFAEPYAGTISWTVDGAVFNHAATGTTWADVDTDGILNQYDVLWQLIHTADGNTHAPDLSADNYLSGGDTLVASDSFRSGDFASYYQLDAGLWRDPNSTGLPAMTTPLTLDSSEEYYWVYQRVYELDKGATAPVEGTYYWDSGVENIRTQYDGQINAAAIYLDSSEGGTTVIGAPIKPNLVVQGTSVPEPATMSLLGLGALAMALRRKLRK